MKRGRVTLCRRKDAPWLAAGAAAKFDTLAVADADIPDVIATVREYFRANRTAFFDDVVTATGCDEGAVLRSVWYLAWAGELTCDTYECLRYSNFQVTVSACYDLDSTPRKILSGRVGPERAIGHMKRRGLDPRLGRWSATERLVPPAKPLGRETVVRHWAKQMLARWGIVTKDILVAEAAAPSWGELAREFKRLELLGAVSRGHFIESHQGPHYGLPEAIELLRDCRARRSDGKELGYLPDEPVLAVTSRDPANLYASCLEVVEENGEHLRRRMRRGNLVHRLAVQAGQVLVYQDTQLASLTRRQLARCIDALRHDCGGNPVRTALRRWNGYPVDVSPVAGLLWEMGFRFEGSRGMVWPPRKSAAGDPPEPGPDVFPPHYQQPPPVQYGPEWLIARARPKVRPLLSPLFEALQAELSRPGWTLTWAEDGPHWSCRDVGRAHVRVGATMVWVNLGVRTFRIDGRSRGFWRNLRATPGDGVTDEFLTAFRAAREKVEQITTECLAQQKGNG